MNNILIYDDRRVDTHYPDVPKNTIKWKRCQTCKKIDTRTLKLNNTLIEPSKTHLEDDSQERVHLKTCSECKATYYCSVECQKSDWNEHKKRCKLEKEVYKHVLLSKELVIEVCKQWKYFSEIKNQRGILFIHKDINKVPHNIICVFIPYVLFCDQEERDKLKDDNYKRIIFNRITDLLEENDDKKQSFMTNMRNYNINEQVFFYVSICVDDTERASWGLIGYNEFYRKSDYYLSHPLE